MYHWWYKKEYYYGREKLKRSNIMNGFKRKFISPLIVIGITLLSGNVLSEECKDKCNLHNKKLKLQSYEPTTIGWNWDAGDVKKGYMDFKISLKYPMFHDGIPKPTDNYLPSPYFAFSGRFAQYIGSRDSSPVIGKRFNPKLFLRYWVEENNEDKYFDIGYAHESNGQRISSATTYQNLANDFVNQGEEAYFADDYISRGWDYLDFNWKHNLELFNGKVSTYINYKYFLDDGLLQGKPEEYQVWEGGTEGKTRKQVDGISVIAKYSKGFGKNGVRCGILSSCKIALLYTTGTQDSFKYNTTRIEFTTEMLGLPVMLWASRGYNSDLVDYYQNIDSYGISFEMKTFLEDI